MKINNDNIYFLSKKQKNLHSFGYFKVQQKSRKFIYDKSKREFNYEKMTEHQIVSILKEAGIPVKELCHKYGMGNSTFYKWREKYGGMET